MTIREQRFDYGSIEKFTDENGFMNVTGKVARTGVMEYRQGDGTIRRELVTPECLFNVDSMEGMKGKPVTNDHPQGLVNPDNYKELSQGSTLNAEEEGEFLSVEFSVNGAEAIQAVKGGKSQLSPGYSVELEKVPGVWNGQEYDAKQTSRTYNHLAIVPQARGGSDCRINFDAAYQVTNQSEASSMATVTLSSGATIEVGDASAASAIASDITLLKTNMDSALELAADTEAQARRIAMPLIHRLDMDMEKEDMSEEMDMMKKKDMDMEKEDGKMSMDMMQKKADEMKAKYDGFMAKMKKMKEGGKEEKMDAADIDSRIELINRVQRFDSTIEYKGKSDIELMSAALVKHDSTINLDGESADYVRAAFLFAEKDIDKSNLSQHQPRMDSFNQTRKPPVMNANDRLKKKTMNRWETK